MARLSWAQSPRLQPSCGQGRCARLTLSAGATSKGRPPRSSRPLYGVTRSRSPAAVTRVSPLNRLACGGDFGARAGAMIFATAFATSTARTAPRALAARSGRSGWKRRASRRASHIRSPTSANGAEPCISIEVRGGAWVAVMRRLTRCSISLVKERPAGANSTTGPRFREVPPKGGKGDHFNLEAWPRYSR